MGDVERPECVLRREPPVAVVVAAQDERRPRADQGLPDGLHLEVIAVLARAVARVMPIGNGAGRGMGREVLPQPDFLRGSARAAADIWAVGIESDQVPGPQVEAVPALAGVACGR